MRSVSQTTTAAAAFQRPPQIVPHDVVSEALLASAEMLGTLTVMRAIVLSVCLIAVGSRGIAQAVASDRDRSVIQAVLVKHAVPELVRNWSVDRDAAEVVLTDGLLGCQLPVGHVETARINKLLTRAADGMKVDERDLRYRVPSQDDDLAVTPSRVVPRALVKECQAAGAARLSSIAVNTDIPVMLEDAEVVVRYFRRDPVRWRAKYPLAVGVITFGRPVYAGDGQMAAVSYTRLRNGIGGGSFFCLLARSGSVWEVLWQETILIE